MIIFIINVWVSLFLIFMCILHDSESACCHYILFDVRWWRTPEQNQEDLNIQLPTCAYLIYFSNPKMTTFILGLHVSEWPINLAPDLRSTCICPAYMQHQAHFPCLAIKELKFLFKFTLMDYQILPNPNRTLIIVYFPFISHSHFIKIKKNQCCWIKPEFQRTLAFK